MPLSEIDRAEVKREARGLLRSASVSPFKLMALFLLICLALDEISTAAGFLLRGALPFDPAAPADALPVIPRLSGFSLSMLFISILAGLLGMVLRAGFVRYCLGVHRGQAMPYESLFDAFPFAGKVVLLAFLEGLLAALGFMAFIFPGIYVLLIYSLAIFRLVETPEISVFEAMRRSRLDLRGRLTEYFALLLSFSRCCSSSRFRWACSTSTCCEAPFPTRSRATCSTRSPTASSRAAPRSTSNRT